MALPVAADRFLFYAFLVLLLWMPLPFGSNVTWASSLMEAWVFLIAALWLVQYYRGKVSLTKPFVCAWPVTACLLATLLWIIVQSLPLPAGLLGLLSPRALEIHSTTHSYPSLSLDVYATRQAALQTLAYLLCFCLTLLLVNNEPRIKKLAQAIILGGLFQAAYGSLMTLSGLEYGFFIHKEVAGIATGTFINRNHLAGYLEMCLATGIGVILSELASTGAGGWRDSTRRLLRTLLGNKARVRLALVVMVTGLVLTRSRAGNVAFTASLAGVGGFYFLAVRKLSGRTIAFFASLLVIDLLIVGNFFGIQKVAERIQQTSLDSEDRVNTNRDALAMLRDFPLTGTGAGSFSAVYPMFTSAVVVTSFTRHAEDDYLQFACEFGLVFAAVLGAAVLASLWTAIRAQLKRHDPLLQGMGFAATMAIVALLIHSAVDFNLQMPSNAAMFVVILALGWVCRYWEPRSFARRGGDGSR
ncbi:MAG TPA: O-antigen ligase family protein [Steroidobacteraceae bacterium]